MYYYWWLVSIILYLFVLLIYVVGSYLFFGDHKISSIDTVFFGIASIITLSVIPLMKINIYGV